MYTIRMAPAGYGMTQLDEEEESQFWNHYCHDDCPVEPGIEWEDQWSCGCDDECPACGTSISPYQSDEIT